MKLKPCCFSMKEDQGRDEPYVFFDDDKTSPTYRHFVPWINMNRYAGQITFVYCPWCGKKLEVIEE